MPSEECEEELEVCQSIFTEEEFVTQPPAEDGSVRVTLHLRPNTADDATQLFVMLSLELCLSAAYPAGKDPVSFKVSEAQGLDDAQMQQMLDTVRTLAVELCGDGEPVIFSVGEAIKVGEGRAGIAPHPALLYVGNHYEGLLIKSGRASPNPVRARTILLPKTA